MDKNPDYVTSRWSLNNKIATRCRICGRQLTHPLEAKNEVHDYCLQNYKKKTYGVN